MLLLLLELEALKGPFLREGFISVVVVVVAIVIVRKRVQMGRCPLLLIQECRCYVSGSCPFPSMET